MIFVIFERKELETMKTERQIIGRRGEDEACAYLERNGHTVLARNWTSGHLELDIVSLKDGTLHFVEVKSRCYPFTADPLVGITRAKMKNVTKAAGAFLKTMRKTVRSSDWEICFDVITIIFTDNSHRVEYYPQAFIPTYV